VLAGRVEVLATLLQERLEHHADDRLVAGRDLRADLLGHHRLTAVVLAAVAVARVDDDPLRQARRTEELDSAGDGLRVVVRPAVGATQYEVAVRVAAGVQDRGRAVVVDTGEDVRYRGSLDRVDGRGDRTVGAVLHPDRHRQA
jgi:hypothetical protein